MTLTDEQLMDLADNINKKIGGDKKVEFASLKIIVDIVKALLSTVA
jgi:hypothetical protein